MHCSVCSDYCQEKENWSMNSGGISTEVRWWLWEMIKWGLSFLLSLSRGRGQSLIQNGQNGQNSIWRGKEVSRGHVCGKGSLVWQNITELLIPSSSLTSGARWRNFSWSGFLSEALEAKCFPYRRKSLAGKQTSEGFLLYFFSPCAAVSEASIFNIFLGMKPSLSSLSALLSHSPQGSSSCPPWWQERGTHSRLSMDPWLCCSGAASPDGEFKLLISRQEWTSCPRKHQTGMLAVLVAFFPCEKWLFLSLVLGCWSQEGYSRFMVVLFQLWMGLLGVAAARGSLLRDAPSNNN